MDAQKQTDNSVMDQMKNFDVNMNIYLAHTPNHLLSDHLKCVADQCMSLVYNIKSKKRECIDLLAKEAYIVGIYHDIGKYRVEFQEYLRGKRDKGDSTHHKHVGHFLLHSQSRLDLGLVVLGHHSGLINLSDLPDLKDYATKEQLQDYKKIWLQEVKDEPSIDSRQRTSDAFIDYFRLKFLHSCLVDSDWIDTSNYIQGQSGNRAVPVVDDSGMDFQDMFESLKQYVRDQSSNCQNVSMSELRQLVWDKCCSSAGHKPGLFELTSPTGSGKTTASMAFALQHAQKNNMSRIIYVAPYISVVQQNSRVFKESLLLNDSDIIEHHSLSTQFEEDDNPQNMAGTSNWNAKIIVTTDVQFFESLFSCKPGKCRKIHNIANSVIILDEIQALSPGLLQPTCHALELLTKQYNCSIAFTTATQPDWQFEGLFSRSTRVRRMLSNKQTVFNEMKKIKKTNIIWPNDSESIEWDEIASELLKCNKLTNAITVNTRRAAQDLFKIFESRDLPNVYHLSKTMFPADIIRKLNRIKDCLKTRRECYVLSTPLIEAGVDLDFDCYFREIASLVSIVQSLGRNNREAVRNLESTFRMFIHRDSFNRLPSDRWYRAGMDILKSLLQEKENNLDLYKIKEVKEYFQRLYKNFESLDEKNVLAECRNFEFRTVSENYRIITQKGLPVIVGKGHSDEKIVQKLLQNYRSDTYNKSDILKKLSRYSVELFANQIKKFHQYIEHDEKCDLRIWNGPYDSDLGIDLSLLD